MPQMVSKQVAAPPRQGEQLRQRGVVVGMAEADALRGHTRALQVVQHRSAHLWAAGVRRDAQAGLALRDRRRLTELAIAFVEVLNGNLDDAGTDARAHDAV